MQTMLDSSALFPMQYQLLSWTRRFRGRTSADDFDTDLRSVLLRESVAAEATTSDAAATPAAAADGVGAREGDRGFDVCAARMLRLAPHAANAVFGLGRAPLHACAAGDQ